MNLEKTRKLNKSSLYFWKWLTANRHSSSYDLDMTQGCPCLPYDKVRLRLQIPFLCFISEWRELFCPYWSIKTKSLLTKLWSSSFSLSQIPEFDSTISLDQHTSFSKLPTTLSRINWPQSKSFCGLLSYYATIVHLTFSN